MLTLHDLTITNNSGKILLDHFDLVLNDHERIALIGEEGNGKSTLMKIIAGIDLPYVQFSGKIDLHHEKIGYLSQVLEEDWYDLTPYEYCLKENVNDEIPLEKYNELSYISKLCIQLHLPNDFVERNIPIRY